ncbi:MAG: hypothetical protein IPM63_13685 [Acidobacteriota bacterium]|nr:MAG: hypothetical protein IPM63_13685 [Acidobacteriota bacterium]
MEQPIFHVQFELFFVDPLELAKIENGGGGQAKDIIAIFLRVSFEFRQSKVVRSGCEDPEIVECPFEQKFKAVFIIVGELSDRNVLQKQPVFSVERFTFARNFE